MSRAAFLFLSALAGTLAAPSTAAAGAIALRSQATVGGPVFRLQDIADLSQVDPGARARLAAIEVGVVPRPGHTERLSREQVGRAIETQVPEWRSKFEIGGSKLVTVRGIGVAVNQEELVRLAAGALQAELASRYEKLEITRVGQTRAMALPPAAQLRVRPVNAPLSRRMAVWVEIQVDGRAYAALPVWFSVAAWKRVPVARTDLPAGSVLRAADLALEMRDLAQAGKVLDHMPPEQGARLRRALAHGMPVAQSAVDFGSAVSRNQAVAVRIAAGSIVIESAGIAQVDGRVGDLVKIKNPGSSEVFPATVVEPGVVSVNAR